MEAVRREVQPAVFTGDVGDTLFWHSRLVVRDSPTFKRLRFDFDLVASLFVAC